MVGVGDRDASFTALLVVEGPTDERRIRVLLSAWLRSQADWMDDPEAFVRLSGIEPGASRLRVSAIPGLYQSIFKSMPGYHGGVGKGDAGTFRQLRVVLMTRSTPIHPFDLLIWIRDDDGDSRAVGVVEARNKQNMEEAAKEAEMAVDSPLTHVVGKKDVGRWPLPTAIGYAQQCGEAWTLSAYTPSGRKDEKRMATVHKDLGHSSVDRAHELTHKEVPGGAKDVLRRLLDGELEDVHLERAVQERPTVCKASGLLGFLQELDEQFTSVLFGSGA